MIITISVQIDGQYFLKYSYIPTIPSISYDKIEELDNAIKAFILYTIDRKEKKDEHSTGE